MNRITTWTLLMASCAALGTTAVNSLYAQGKTAGAYVIVDISEITNPDGFRQLFSKSQAPIAAFGGHIVTATQNITPLDGAAPKRFIIIGFDSVDKAKAWSASADQKEVDDIRMKNTKSRSFIVAPQGT